jgi:hypothetical protein
MAITDLATAQAQIDLDLQSVQKDVDLTQNMDSILESMFADALPGTDIGLQEYRHPIQYSIGGHTGGYQPDGGIYPMGLGPGYSQFVVAPVPVISAFAATELMQRIGNGGAQVSAVDPVSRMVADAKTKHAHSRSTYLQGYNNGILATVDPTYVGTNVVPMANVSFGARLLDNQEKYQVTDANLNVVDTVFVVDTQKNSIGAGDTATLDHVPAGLAPGYNFIPTGVTSGTPLWVQGLEYIVSPANAGDYDGVDRATSWVQAPALNATNGTLTLGTVEIFKARQEQALGTENWMDNGTDAFWYTHQSQRASAAILGFAKSTYMLTGNGTANYDIGPNHEGGKWKISGRDVMDESIAAIDKLYSLRKSGLRKVRYPGSQKFIPFGGSGALWWPRTDGEGNWLAEYDIRYQDSSNYYGKMPWWNGVIHNLGINPAFQDTE